MFVKVKFKSTTIRIMAFLLCNKTDLSHGHFQEWQEVNIAPQNVPTIYTNTRYFI